MFMGPLFFRPGFPWRIYLEDEKIEPKTFFRLGKRGGGAKTFFRQILKTSPGLLFLN